MLFTLRTRRIVVHRNSNPTKRWGSGVLRHHGTVKVRWVGPFVVLTVPR